MARGIDNRNSIVYFNLREVLKDAGLGERIVYVAVKHRIACCAGFRAKCIPSNIAKLLRCTHRAVALHTHLLYLCINAKRGYCKACWRYGRGSGRGACRVMRNARAAQCANCAGVSKRNGRSKYIERCIAAERIVRKLCHYTSSSYKYDKQPKGGGYISYPHIVPGAVAYDLHVFS